jgi:signal transduction histidine kinase
MKIVQLEDQSERSLSARNAFERYADVTLVQTGTIEGLLHELEGRDVDLILYVSSFIPEDALALVAERAPDVPVILLASEAERRRLLQDATLPVWDVVSPSEMDRLPLSIMRAIQSRRERRGLRDELAQARELLLSCQKSIAVGRLLGSIAHEINNPLEAISNLLYLGQRNLSDEEETRKCFQMAEEELQRVGEIT